MKFNRKKIFVTALAVCLIAILSIGTLAWFNATDDITNNFFVADSDGDGTPDFTVEVWEHENDGTDGVDEDGDGDPTITHEGNEYEKIAPGDVIDKDPTVENTGDYDQWIRVHVTFDNWSAIEAACLRYANDGLTTDLRTWLNVNYGLTTPAWTPANDIVEDTASDTITYTYYYNGKLAKDETVTLFTKVSIPGAFQQQDMVFANNNFSIVVKAEALQADNTGTNAYDAFSAYWGD